MLKRSEASWVRAFTTSPKLRVFRKCGRGVGAGSATPDDHMLDSKCDDDLRGCAFVSTVASSVIEDSVESSLGALFARTAVSQKSLQGLLDAIEQASVGR